LTRASHSAIFRQFLGPRPLLSKPWIQREIRARTVPPVTSSWSVTAWWATDWSRRCGPVTPTDPTTPATSGSAAAGYPRRRARPRDKVVVTADGGRHGYDALVLATRVRAW